MLEKTENRDSQLENDQYKPNDSQRKAKKCMQTKILTESRVV